MNLTEHEEYLLNRWVRVKEVKRLGDTFTICVLKLVDGREVLGVHESGDNKKDLESNNVKALKEALMKVKTVDDHEIMSGIGWF